MIYTIVRRHGFAVSVSSLTEGEGGDERYYIQLGAKRCFLHG